MSDGEAAVDQLADSAWSPMALVADSRSCGRSGHHAFGTMKFTPDKMALRENVTRRAGEESGSPWMCASSPHLDAADLTAS